MPLFLMIKYSREIENQIEKMVKAFYGKATTDFLIGYHFRKIQTKKGIHPLTPPLEAFSEHIPRITQFWVQRLTDKNVSISPSIKLIEVHRDLNIKKAELKRWMLLFKDILKEEKKKNACSLELILLWEEKLQQFEEIFLQSPLLFR